MKNEFITQPHNYCQIPIYIPACIMNSEYFTITYLYIDQITNLWMVKNAINCFEGIYIKFEKTELVEIS